MKQIEKERLKQQQSGLLNNMGSPRSRIRIEKIRSVFLDSKTDVVATCQYEIHVPENLNDLEDWVLRLGKKIGLKNWQEIDNSIYLPKEKFIVVHSSSLFSRIDLERKNIDSIPEVISNAILLSKCNSVFYLPDGPRIFSRIRLERIVRLIKIDNNKFYELD